MKTECPKSVWVAIRTYIPQDRAAYVYESKPKMLPQYKGLMVLKRYHLFPGNEVKLKRENAMMRRWIKMAFVAEQFVRAHKEIERKMPGLFEAKRRGSK